MIGAIAGDIIGSIYEFNNIKTKDFELFGEGCDFTDDTVLTVAVAKWLLGGGDLDDHLCLFGLKYNARGYGGMFYQWMSEWDRQPYNSWGNGSAMRVSPVGWFAKAPREALDLAEKSAEVTHNHPEGIKGAQTTALAVWLAKERSSHASISHKTASFSGYDLSESVDSIRDWYAFDVSCRGTVPQAIRCALEAQDYEDAIRNAISIGGDSDTVACITGGIAEAMYGLPIEIMEQARSYLPDDMIEVVDQFMEYEEWIEGHSVMGRCKREGLGNVLLGA